MRTIADELLVGAVDMHVHGYPELGLDVKGRTDDWELIADAKTAGLRAIVLKSHLWPTFPKTYYLNRAFNGIRVIGGIALNTIVGGLSTVTVESAAKLGAKIVWMPTFTAKNDVDRNGAGSMIFKRFVSPRIPGDPITVLNRNGELRQEAVDVLNVMKEHDLVMSTGHLSAEESMVLVPEAYRLGMRRLCVGHPVVPYIQASLEQQKELAKFAYLEYTFIISMPMHARIDPKVTAEAIKTVGASRCILSTDTIFSWNPPQHEMFRMQVSSMLELGMHENDVKTMIQDNPARLFGL